MTSYDRIVDAMKFLFKRILKKTIRKTVSDYKQEVLIRYGGEQLKVLAKKGLGIPVALL